MRLLAPLVLALAAACQSGSASHEAVAAERMTSMALRVHHMEAMVAFYTEAFGAHFEEVETQGLTSYFGECGGVLLKFVPLRDGTDFEGYPSHQPGFFVDDIEEVFRLAELHGGAVEAQPIRVAAGWHAAVRDPDGNTLELYSRD